MITFSAVSFIQQIKVSLSFENCGHWEICRFSENTEVASDDNKQVAKTPSNLKGCPSSMNLQ